MNARMGIALLMLGSAVVSGCALAPIQTARTLPEGNFETMFSMGGASSRVQSTEGGNPLLMQVAFRYGLSDTTDLGAAPYMMGGALVDVKHNFLDPASRWALSGQLGLAGSWWDGKSLYHVPITLHVAYDTLSWLTLYGSVGYGAFWVKGWENAAAASAWAKPAARTGWGNGLLMVRTGIELRTGERLSVMLEARPHFPLNDDPGDGYSFSRGCEFDVGFRFY